MGAGVNIGLNIYLIPRYGVVGSACATVLAFIAMSLSIFLRTYKIFPVLYNWIACFYPVIFMGIVFYTGDDVLIRLIVTICYPIGWYLFAINSEERKIMKGLIT